MDLDEYLFLEKKKDQRFTHRYMAKKLGISATHLSAILHKRHSPCGIAHKLWEVTEGKVDIGKLLTDYFEAVRK